MSFLSTTIVSALNNYNSICPIVTKDLVENFGRTGMAYYSAGKNTRSYEAKEKFIEANATSILWYGAIPFIKKVFDLTVFKGVKLNPNASLEILKKDNPQSIEKIQERISKGLLPKTFQKGKNLFTGKVSIADSSEILGRIAKKASTYKHLHISRNLLAMAIPTILSAFVLPKAIIAFTQRNVDKQHLNCQLSYGSENDSMKFPIFKEALKKSNKKNGSDKVRFSGLSDKLLASAMAGQKSLLPDMVAVDLGISSSRVYYANKREKEALNGRISNAPYAAALEKIIREGGFLYLIYFGGKHIKNFIDKMTNNALDPKVLEDKNFIKELKENQFTENPLKGMNEEQILDYIDKNIRDDKNVFVKYAKKMEIIKTVKNEKGEVYRNPLIWQDTKQLSEYFETLSAEAKKLIAGGGSSLEAFVAKKSKIKRAGIYGNLIASSFAVCYILPKIMYSFRKWYTGSSEEPGIDKVIHTNCALK